MENLGKIFKVERSKLRITIEDVSKSIRIRPHIIEAIENGDFHQLPSVYMKAFIKDYAKYLKLNIDVEEILNSVAPKDKLEVLAAESGRKTDAKQLEPKKYEDIFSEKKIKKNFFNRTSIATYLVYSSLILILIVILYFAFFNFSGSIPENSFINQQSAEGTEVLADESLANTKSGLIMDSMRLHILAKDTIWLRLASDGINSKQIVLYPGNDFEMKAWEYFTLTCDKANAIEVHRNDELIPQLNNRGTAIRNVKITRNDIINPTAVFSDSSAKRRREAVKKVEENKDKNQPYRLQPSRIETKRN